MVDSDYVEYTRKSQLTEDESKRHENKIRKVRADGNKLRTEKEWRPFVQLFRR